MKYLITGVVLVFFVQAGFIAFTNVDWIKRAPISDVVVEHGEPQVVENREKYDDLDLYTAEDDGRVPKSPITRFRPIKVAAKTALEQLVTPPSRLNVFKNAGNSRPRTMAFRPLVLAPETADYPLSASVAKHSRKKSFLSRTVSVLRKPYDFMKFIGSKLD